MRYYISDLHFFHNALNMYMDKRGFLSQEEMHQYMVQKWNNKVRDNDEVVILGDFSIGKGKETEEILHMLHGKKFLIKGNHDRFLKDKNFDLTCFEWIKDYHEMYDNKRKVILSHYPIFCYNGQYRRNRHDEPKTYMLYGHVHNSFDEILVNQFIHTTKSSERTIRGSGSKKGQMILQKIPCQMINCFCMFSEYVPLTLDEWIENDKIRRDKILETEHKIET